MTSNDDPIEIQVTVVNGDQPDPAVSLPAAVHPDDLGGIKMVQDVADHCVPGDIHGTLSACTS